MSVKEKIILSLDTSDPDYAMQIVDKFMEDISIFKVGLELFTISGGEIVKKIIKKGRNVFLDLKFHDIPNTVARAAQNATRMGVYMFNIHTSGGSEMIKKCRDAVVETCLRENLMKPKIIGVTVLTSITDDILKNELCISHTTRTHVKHLSKLALNSGLDGVVASGYEIEYIKNTCGKNFLVVVPGIRCSWNPPDDQKRRITPKEALRAGADYIVLGRAIMREDDPLKALKLILLEIMSI